MERVFELISIAIGRYLFGFFGKSLRKVFNTVFGKNKSLGESWGL